MEQHHGPLNESVTTSARARPEPPLKRRDVEETAESQPNARKKQKETDRSPSPQRQTEGLEQAPEVREDEELIVGYSEDGNGLRVEHISEEECAFLYQEIFVQQAYMQHGVVIQEGLGDILDVGANIGLFALFCHSQLSRGGCAPRDRIFAFEPVEKIAKVLERNLKDVDGAVVCSYGLGSSQSEHERFFFFSDSPGESTRHHEESKRMKAIMGSSREANQVMECAGEIRTLSRVIREEKIQKIQLLKVDVEGDELHVLMGIETEDWSKIQQIALECHDEDYRLARIKGLLERHGFKVVSEEQKSSWEEDFLLFVPKDLKLHYVYGVR